MISFFLIFVLQLNITHKSEFAKIAAGGSELDSLVHIILQTVQKNRGFENARPNCGAPVIDFLAALNFSFLPAKCPARKVNQNRLTIYRNFGAENFSLSIDNFIKKVYQ